MFCFVLSVMMGCKHDVPSGIISAGKMEKILYDYHVAQAMADGEEGDAVKNRYIYVSAVFRKYNVTEAQFDSTLVYWSENAEDFKDIYKNVYTRLEEEGKMMGVQEQQVNSYNNLTAEGDTANVWNGNEFAILVGNSRDNIFMFHIDADTTYHAGDSFTWAFTNLFYTGNTYARAFVMLNVQYENDSIEGVVRQLNGLSSFTLDLYPTERMKAWKIKSIDGTVYVPVCKEGLCVLSLTDIVLVRRHDKMVNKPAEEEKTDSAKVARPASAVGHDSAHVRQTPLQIRGDKAETHKFDIVRDKPLKGRIIRRRKR